MVTAILCHRGHTSHRVTCPRSVCGPGNLLHIRLLDLDLKAIFVVVVAVAVVVVSVVVVVVVVGGVFVVVSCRLAL